MDDASIVELFLARDEAAIKETADKYGESLRKLAFSITRDSFTAEECENDTYIKVWNSIPPNEPRDGFYSFVAKITRNISLNAVREKNRMKRSAELTLLTSEADSCLPDADSFDSWIDEIRLTELINDFLRSIPKEKRMIFIRRYWYFDSVSEISDTFKISESKVKTTLFRCRNELKEFLEKEGYSL